MRPAGRLAGALLLALLLPAPAPAQPPSVPPAAAKPKPRPARPADLADQLAGLVFDANPATATPARDVLSRWAGPMRLFVFGRPADSQDAARAAASLSRATGLPMQLVAASQVAQLPPNTFLVADENLPGAFRGPLRQMLRNAFLDNEAAVDSYIDTVVAVQPCWTLPVWTDSTRLILKAAVIGIDARQPRPAIQRCMVQTLAAAIGLMGPGGALPGSVFTPQARAIRPSGDDTRLLRLLYGPTLRTGMTREQVHAAALAALQAPRPAPPRKTR
ncbi:DUF2927 domain-containing protein [Limobrevibacterium gyesilva]|uniref:DUF2927 domain-containing protein n=1 Tax=Limobrevibacterium gyesilva TaxID=2991712 RepID=A0AA41YN63_9PROT|nr:DUF2927 domain-containing protein [Limobrevibacterium gyesilva]MCW3473573.1 DUF2927 domain-containing protein [Limobrevibacterium gyesilva]